MLPNSKSTCFLKISGGGDSTTSLKEEEGSFVCVTRRNHSSSGITYKIGKKSIEYGMIIDTTAKQWEHGLGEVCI